MSSQTCARRTLVALVGLSLTAITLSDAAIALSIAPRVPPAVLAKLKQYNSRYYILFSDLDPEKVQVAVARVTCVAEEYNEATKGFSGALTSKWPFFLMNNAADYQAAGGQAAGVAYKDRLMALASFGSESGFWFTVQHEMFHQFGCTVISQNMPVWANEGLADYYGEAVWTGDGIATAIIPAEGNRLEYLRMMIKNGRTLPFSQIIMKRPNEWRDQALYAQGWAMVYFFKHAENGKYQTALTAYLKATAAGAPWDAAFARAFGRNFDALQKEWAAWWLADRQADADRAYAQATAATLASFLGRAWSQGQKFATVEEFLKAAHDPDASGLKKSPKQPLPDELLKEALDRADKFKGWSLENPGTGLPKLVLALDDGTTFTATFTLLNGKVTQVKTTVKEGGATPDKKDD